MSGIKYLSIGNLALFRCLALLRDDRGLLTLIYLQLEEIILCKKSNLLSRLSSWRILTQLLRHITGKSIQIVKLEEIEINTNFNDKQIM